MENTWSQDFYIFLTSITIFGFPLSSLPLNIFSKILPLPTINHEGHLSLDIAWFWLRIYDYATSCLDMLSEDFVITNNFFDYWIPDVMKEKHTWIIIFLDCKV